MRKLVIIFLLVVPSISFADLMVSFIEESKLPYELSPRNYDNSSRNYDNSVRNYDNSPRNYDNSERNYDNSSRNYGNGKNGDNRLLIKDGYKTQWVGYYVKADNGVINFFSTSGKRLFYNPKGGSGVFDSDSGSFCGVLALVRNQYQLVLTETGQKVLLIGQ